MTSKSSFGVTFDGIGDVDYNRDMLNNVGYINRLLDLHVLLEKK